MSAIADYVAERSPTSGAPQPLSEASWAPATLIAFRFCFLYFGLYVLTTQMLAGMVPNPKFSVPVLGAKLPMRPVVLWVGNHLLGVQPTVHPTGSGDTLAMDFSLLPLYGPDFVEANSPPLYYALVAPIATESAYPPPLVWSDVNGALVVSTYTRPAFRWPFHSPHRP